MKLLATKLERLASDLNDAARLIRSHYNGAKSTPKRAAGKQGRLTARDIILDVLAAKRGKPARWAEDFIPAFEKAKRAPSSPMLTRMCALGEIKKVSRGEYIRAGRRH